MATYSVITTEALGEIRKFHHRSPRVLLPGDWQAWLAGTVDEAVSFLEPEEVPLQVHRVGLAVGNPRNQGEQLVARINPA